MPRAMARRHRHEEHVNHEAWAIPYGDLITLLLAFFVVMYAISTLNEGKYRVMSESLNAAFDGVPRSIAPIQVGEPTSASSIAPPKPFETDPGSRDLVQLTDRVRADALITPIELMQLEQAEAQAEAQLDAIQRQVERVLGPLIMSDQVTVTREGLWLEVNIRSDVLFASVDPRRMAAVGFGEKRPVADNGTPAGRAANRRVMLVILATSSAPAAAASGAAPAGQETAGAAVVSGAATPLSEDGL